METGYSMKISSSKCRLGVHCCSLALLARCWFSFTLAIKSYCVLFKYHFHKYIKGKVCVLHSEAFEIMS